MKLKLCQLLVPGALSILHGTDSHTHCYLCSKHQMNHWQKQQKIWGKTCTVPLLPPLVPHHQHRHPGESIKQAQRSKQGGGGASGLWIMLSSMCSFAVLSNAYVLGEADFLILKRACAADSRKIFQKKPVSTTY